MVARAFQGWMKLESWDGGTQKQQEPVREPVCPLSIDDGFAQQQQQQPWRVGTREHDARYLDT